MSADGRRELIGALAAGRHLLLLAAAFSVFVNLLGLTGALFMLQVYDRVLPSGSVETLAALLLLTGFLYGILAVLDLARARIMARLAARFQLALDPAVFAAAQTGGAAQLARADLEHLRRFIASPVMLAAFDAPWAPLFFLALFLFHPWLGLLALSGAALLLVLAAAGEALTGRGAGAAGALSASAERLALRLADQGDLARSMGLARAGQVRWLALREQALAGALAVSDRAAAVLVATRIARQGLQSAMLALGALLVLRGEISAGVMSAATILMGRALAPVELAVAGWGQGQRARLAWGRLSGLLTGAPAVEASAGPLPGTRFALTVEDLAVRPPGATGPSVTGITFDLRPGAALGIMGASGSGKSTLARGLAGIWPVPEGSLQLGGATPAQCGGAAMAAAVGYLPQEVALFHATIAENIARLALAPDRQAVMAAAHLAGAHQMILDLPQGYDTMLGEGGAGLSGGQAQRIALARALYGASPMVVLDEPFTRLDAEGAEAVRAAIAALKAAGHVVIVTGHRADLLPLCDPLLVLGAGQARVFGPREEVLDQMMRATQKPGRAAARVA